MNMKANATLQPRGLDLAFVFQSACNALRRPLDLLNAYNSRVLERPIDTRQTLHLLNAEAAFIMSTFPIDAPLLLRALCVLWLYKAVMRCRKELRTFS